VIWIFTLANGIDLASCNARLLAPMVFQYGRST